MDDLKYIIESLLFAVDTPMTLAQLSDILRDAEKKDISNALQELKNEYETRKGGFYLCQVADGYQLRTRPEYSNWVGKLFQSSPARLSKAALETLAIIAYHQPLIRSDIEHIRGVDSGGIIRNLLERKLIRVLGRKDIPGRPLIYATTKYFLEVFSLQSLKDLPTPKEIEEYGDSPATSPELKSMESLKDVSPGHSDDSEKQIVPEDEEGVVDNLGEPEKRIIPENDEDAVDNSYESGLQLDEITDQGIIQDTIENREAYEDELTGKVIAFPTGNAKLFKENTTFPSELIESEPKSEEELKNSVDKPPTDQEDI